MAQLLLNVGLPLFLVLLAFISGRAVDRNHHRELEERERHFKNMLVTDLKSFPGKLQPHNGGTFVVAEVVIATDYLKSLLAGLRKILGGELKSYHKLVERAQREAILRMMEKAEKQGFNAVCNVRIDFANVGGIGLSSKKGAAMVAMIVSGTAYSTAYTA